MLEIKLLEKCKCKKKKKEKKDNLYSNVKSRHPSHFLLFIYRDDETYDCGDVEGDALDRDKNEKHLSQRK